MVIFSGCFGSQNPIKFTQGALKAIKFPNTFCHNFHQTFKNLGSTSFSSCDTEDWSKVAAENSAFVVTGINYISKNIKIQNSYLKCFNNIFFKILILL